MALIKNQIYYLSGNCLNLKKPYPRECRLCIQVCPHNALTEKKEIIKEKCTECGACVSVCPSDGIVDKDMDNLGRYIFESDNIVLNCPMAEALGFEISCLGALDGDTWLTLIILGEDKEVRLITGDCGKCPDKKACAASIDVLKEILRANPKLTTLKIEILPFKEDLPNNKVVDKKTRNAAKFRLREKSRDKIKDLLANLEDKNEFYDIPKSKKWFAQSLALDPEKRIQYKSLLADHNCTGCGVCSKICPQKAIEQVKKDDMIKLIYVPYNCVQCSRCVDICGSKALKLDYVNFSDKLLNGKILINETKARFCIKCGKQIYHKKEPQLCLSCAVKDPKLKGVLY